MSDNNKIWDLPQSEEGAIRLFQDKGVLPKLKQCINGHEMTLYSFENAPFWKCTTRPCLKKSGLRVGTWLSHSKIPFVTAVRFIYCWVYELTSVKFCERELEINHNTVVDWNNYLREVCVFSVWRKNCGKIGGPGLIVEIDESLFTKRKNNAGRVLPQQWVFGGLCRETGGRFLVPVPNREAKTLMEQIQLHVEPGSTIISDCWRGYNSAELEKAGYTHLTVNHRYNFIDPETGASTQQVERMWGSAKWRNKKHRGTARHHLDSYLAEYMWRLAVAAEGKDPFTTLFTDIADFWVAEQSRDQQQN